MTSFTDATDEQVKELVQRLKAEAIRWAKDNNISGLSGGGSHNVYNAIDQVPTIAKLWYSAQIVMAERMPDGDTAVVVQTIN